MSLRVRIEKLEKQLRAEGFCCECMRVVFLYVEEPDPRPAVCPSCGRGPGDHPPERVRGFVVHWPTEEGLQELPTKLPQAPSVGWHDY